MDVDDVGIVYRFCRSSFGRGIRSPANLGWMLPVAVRTKKWLPQSCGMLTNFAE